MTRKLHVLGNRIIVLVLLSFVLSACTLLPLQTNLPSGVMPTATDPAFITPTSSFLPTFTPGIQTAVPSRATTMALPSTQAPLVSAEVALAPENANHVVELAGWGEGYGFNVILSMSRLVAHGKILVQKEIIDNSPTFSGGTVRTRFWEVPSGDLRLELIHPDGYDGLYVSPDGTRFAIFQNYCHRENPKPCLLEIRSFPANELLLSIDPGFVNSAVFSPDNSMLALSTDIEIAIWSLETGKFMGSLPDSFRFDLLSYSNDGKLLVGSQFMGDGTVHIWNAVTGELLPMVYPGIYSPGYSPDEIAFSSQDTDIALVYGGSIWLWQVSDWSEGPTWTWDASSGITRIAFSPDGLLIASGWTDGKVRLADAASGVVLSSWDSHSDDTYDYISDLAFSPDGKLLISISMDNTLRIWGVQS
jgi:WD40 repeat protein